MAKNGTRLFVGGGCALVLLLFVAGVFLTFGGRKGTVPSRTILELNLETSLPEMESDDPFSVFSSQKLTLRDVVDALEKGGDDPKVVGLVARIGAAPIGLAQVQEVRDAVTAFRAKKKWAIAYSETFGEFGPGNSSYYLATAFDRVILQPSGDVGLNGLVAESVFLRGALDKLGVRPEFDHRYEYKNAMNTFTETKMTEPHREALGKVIGSFYDQIVSGIAQGRGKTPDEVKALVDRGPFLGPEALKEKLVDSLAYWDEALDELGRRGGSGAQRLALGKYLKAAGRPHDGSGPTVALIYGVGGVQRGKSSFNPVTGGQAMGSETVAGAFRKAIDDPDVKAILFRVSSPGGSYVASDTIWRETVRAKKAGKPVVVSMGDVAGSGGYFVAMAASRIVAEPATITGSIGVLGGKMVTPALWEKLGITFDQVQEGANANMWNASKDFSPAEWQRFQAWLDRVYVDFTSKVAEGRKLPKERVLEIAKGRIWSGADAKGLGLVDELGGMRTALALAKKEAKIPASQDVKLVVYPRQRTPFETLAAKLAGEDDDSADAARTESVRALETVRPILKRLAAAGLLGDGEGGVLTMPDVEVGR